MKKLFVSFVMVVLLFTSTITNTQAAEKGNLGSKGATQIVTTPHTYDIVPGTDEWKSLNNAIEKRAACYVSADEAASLTTPALIQTILDYPLLIDAFAYNDFMIGMNAVSNYFPCLDELVVRIDAADCLKQFLQEDDGSNPLIAFYLNALGHYLSYCNNTSENIEEPTRMYTTYVYTPIGHSVVAIVDMTYADHSTDDPNELPMTYQIALSLHYAYQAAYNIISVLAGVCASYNCHAYAWYSQTNTTHWINDPSEYMTDGSYINSTCAAGRKVTYQDASNYYEHSGIVDTATGSFSTTKIVSKWGVAGLYKHYENDCPFFVSIDKVKWWKLN